MAKAGLVGMLVGAACGAGFLFILTGGSPNSWGLAVATFGGMGAVLGAIVGICISFVSGEPGNNRRGARVLGRTLLGAAAGLVLSGVATVAMAGGETYELADSLIVMGFFGTVLGAVVGGVLGLLHV